jgi:hypothetical protein
MKLTIAAGHLFFVEVAGNCVHTPALVPILAPPR